MGQDGARWKGIDYNGIWGTINPSGRNLVKHSMLDYGKAQLFRIFRFPKGFV